MAMDRAPKLPPPSAPPSSRGKAMAFDPRLPPWICHNCHRALRLSIDPPSPTGWDPKAPAEPSPTENTFVVLSPGSDLQTPRDAGGGGICLTRSDSLGGIAMGEAFVLLPYSNSVTHKHDDDPDLSSSASPSSLPSNPFRRRTELLERAERFVHADQQVEQPVCVECMMIAVEGMEKEIEDVKGDIKAYEATLRDILEYNSTQRVGDTGIEIEKLEADERELEAAIREYEGRLIEVRNQSNKYQKKSSLLKEIEERYWNNVNDFQHEIQVLQEKRDARITRNESLQAHLELLNNTNVLLSAFPIRPEGDFGTINNFRLGRLPKQPVESDEVNAAWGQACFLLHTMTSYFHPDFRCQIKIHPRGNCPLISDSHNNTYKLAFSENTFWNEDYDKAMVLFLACIHEFADFAHRKDTEKHIPSNKAFKLPYEINHDNVNKVSIKVSFARREDWTKALKYTLNNLNWLLHWFIKNSTFDRN